MNFQKMVLSGWPQNEAVNWSPDKNEQIDENDSSTDDSDDEPPENNMADTFLQCELSNLAASLQLSCRLVYVKLRGVSL